MISPCIDYGKARLKRVEDKMGTRQSLPEDYKDSVFYIFNYPYIGGKRTDPVIPKILDMRGNEVFIEEKHITSGKPGKINIGDVIGF